MCDVESMMMKEIKEKISLNYCIDTIEVSNNSLSDNKKRSRPNGEGKDKIKEEDTHKSDSISIEPLGKALTKVESDNDNVNKDIAQTKIITREVSRNNI